ncbi:hypothetical protein V7S43_006257 [Phytophthora oleae]|uniref:PiggyBac transposable element-derived protein 4 C-terminal zinc-ribbon domain-containing protein n=1 Tax=Phytophthora oleae TaxID=2107226 RepID=A0ABD3FRN7_9STRA
MSSEDVVMQEVQQEQQEQAALQEVQEVQKVQKVEEVEKVQAEITSSEEVLAAPVEEVEIVEPPAKRAKMETSGRTCQFCSNKKHVAVSCTQTACKKCCLVRGGCPVHVKEIEKVELESTRPRKPVIKNEFRETNFHYYGETVTIFCVRDFFENKKLSQGVLNDQERAVRVSGKASGRRKKKNAGDSKVKELIQCALGKRPAPEGYGPLAGLDTPVQVA